MMPAKVFRCRFLLLAAVFFTTNQVIAQNTSDKVNTTIYQLLSTGKIEWYDRSCLNQQGCSSSSCNCDEYCHALGDCCYDLYQNHTSKELPQRAVKCYDKDESKTRSDIVLISDCPDDYNDDSIRRKCEHHDDLDAIEKTPVSSNRTFVSYRNKYCAVCNHVQDDEFHVWNILVGCRPFYRPRNVSFTSLVQSFMDDDNCDYLYDTLDKRYVRNCLPNKNQMYYQSCSDNYIGPLVELCKGYFNALSIIYKNRLFRIYKNIHCLECDINENTISKNANWDVSCTRMLNDKKQSLAVTLDFTTFLFGSHSQGEDRDCPEKDIKINSIGRCVPLICPDKEVPYFGDCVTDVVVHNRLYALDILFVVNNTVDPDLLQKEIRSLVKNMTMDCYGFYSTKKLNIVSLKVFSGLNQVSRMECSYVEVYIEFETFGSGKTTDCPVRFLEDLRYALSSNTAITYLAQVQEDICSLNQTLELSNLVVHANSLTQSQLDVTCPSIQVQEVLNQNETDLYENDQIKQAIYKVGSQEIDKNDVNATDHGYFICVVLFKSKYMNISAIEMNSSSIIDYGLIISYTGFSVSVVSILVTLVHYICIPHMTTRHNSILVHLLSLTLVTHIVYVTTYFNMLCWWAAVLLHFLFLVMFFTMSLTLLHISIHLRKSENPTYGQNKVKLMTRFMLPGYILPLIIVVTTVTVNALVYKEKQFYGDEKNLCFLSDAMILLYTFAIPVLLSLICNVIIFSVTCKTLCCTDISNDNVNLYHNRFWIVVKLSSLVGFSWILGFIGVLTANQVVVYAFEATSSLQGVFLSFSLLYNHKVKQWYRNCFGSTLTNAEVVN